VHGFLGNPLFDGLASIAIGLLQIRAAHPEVIAVFVKPQTAKTYRHIVEKRYGVQAAQKS
jgi:hypothetical protein